MELACSHSDLNLEIPAQAVSGVELPGFALSRLVGIWV